ncbi:hypothetical protein TW81_10495 [Vibrio galatheae]|uniref:Type VI secretion protein VasB-1 n=1 Tax=Vibrio galatheae TaxID=579748 RepID=A0A0F4NJY0_9VIBR|nr:type VI secretion system baseplate subunit TssG [Vibrio galatheae]KJY83407.1 hypothetical protein TW81_10495 [Vibrio galatheae]
MNVVHDLTHNAQKYDFAQAIRMLSHFVASSPERIRLVLKAEVMPTGDASEVQYFSLKNNNAKLRLAKQALSGVKGVIPFYIYEELLAALHDDDHALKDFLDVFNQRYFELVAQLEVAPWLIVQNELHPDKTSLLNNIAALEERHKNFFQYSFLLSQNSRNLASLQQILNDYFPFDIEVSTKQQERRQLPMDSLTKLGAKRNFNSRIGQGFLLGKTCMIHFSHIVVSIKPANEQDLLDIQSDRMLARSMRELIQHYLRDHTPVSIYLKVKREYLSRPTLSSNKSRAAKLGEVDCLAPERKPHKMISILLK